MSVRAMYEKDADLSILTTKRFAIIGYGNQGHAHALNLRDAGANVMVGQRPGASFDRAVADGFAPVDVETAVARADVIILGLPDEDIGRVYQRHIASGLRAGQAIGFVHGFAVRFGLVEAPEGVDVIMVAPKGPGALVRSAFERGGGLTCIVAVDRDASGRAREIALAWGAGVGGGKGGMIEATFAQECESDLFGEQSVLCGGVQELMKVAFELLVEAGVPEELAYFECIHEVKQVVDLQYTDGLAGMRRRISNTASYGGLTRGPRIIDDSVRQRMRDALHEIQQGAFAREWIAECESGKRRLAALEAAEAAHASEPAGRAVRSLAAGAIRSV
ncbi:MAG: ketol-acid reductoisomerase [Phycisphaerales bacterium]|nr:ketol-acid reductoisomerase [Phycisphaerales bacterium]